MTVTTVSFGLSSDHGHILYRIRSVYIMCFYDEKCFLSRFLLSTEIYPFCPCEMLLDTQYSQEVVSYKQTGIFLDFFTFIISCCNYRFYRSNPDYKLQFFKQSQYTSQSPHPKVNWNLPPRIPLLLKREKPGNEVVLISPKWYFHAPHGIVSRVYIMGT